jgi:UPF0755 protein
LKDFCLKEKGKMDRLISALFKIINIIVWALLPLQILLIFYLAFNFLYFTPVAPESNKKILVSVKPNTSFKSVANHLSELGLIRSKYFLQAIAKYNKLETEIKFGDYELSPSMSSYAILDKLRNGKTYKIKISIPEGSTLNQIAQILNAANLVDTNSFNNLLEDQELIAAANAENNSLEGYLYPDTYYFEKHTPPNKIFHKLIGEAKKNWTPELSSKANNLGLSRHEVLTLASIVEKESGNFSEQPIIASVFHNRIKKGMKLQSDPTVIYSIKDFNGNITKEDLGNTSPYNTYTSAGLPPGPICNPSLNAIKAVLFPNETNYLFFVSNNVGGHIFSTNYEDHQKEVTKYQLGNR